jgi:general secretion pathway protein G
MNQRRGFTLIELLVVLAILAVLLSIAAPRYFESLDKAKETTLRTDLRLMREAIDRYYGDTGRYPDSLQALAQARYLKAVPKDPVTDSADSWVVVGAPDGVTPGVYDVRSGAPGTGRDGTALASW